MTTWNLPVTDDAREALALVGITDAPATVTLILRSASQREMEFVEAAQEPGGLLTTDPVGFYAELLRRRVDPPVPVPVLREVVRDVPFAEQGELVFAFVRGERGNTKALRRAVSSTLNGMTDKLLNALSENVNSPTTPPSTA